MLKCLYCVFYTKKLYNSYHMCMPPKKPHLHGTSTAPLPDMNRILSDSIVMNDKQHNDRSVRSHLFHSPLDSKPL